MSAGVSSPLAEIESRLRWLLPADLYAAAWVDPAPATLARVFEHLRTLQRNLHDYLPRLVVAASAAPDAERHAWQAGSLMFTDLAGFTPLLEANLALGPSGAASLLRVLTRYFAAMIEIVGMSGGNLLEFTGDAMLIIFPADQRGSDTAHALRAGLRMQRAMAEFAAIDTPHGPLSLGMRIGVHAGRFLSASIGTPRRREYVLLGDAVQRTKQAEGAGAIGRVCLTAEAHARAGAAFRYEPGAPEHLLAIDDFGGDRLGEYEIALAGRRAATPMLLDRSVPGIVGAIEQALDLAEPLASYFPQPILGLLVEHAAQRRIAPVFPTVTVLFVNLVGLSQAVDRALPGEEAAIVQAISRAFALINAAVESRGGVLKNVTYERGGSDILIYFGAPNAHIDDPRRAAEAALAIQAIVAPLPPLRAGGAEQPIYCQIGMAIGPAFAAEIGEPRGRREFNVLGDAVNTAARLMIQAAPNQILITGQLQAALAGQLACLPREPIALKGKSAALTIFELEARQPAA